MRLRVLFGPICPKLDKAARSSPYGATPITKTQILAEISHPFPDEANAILVMDQAGWRISNHRVVPGNITILPLSPKSRELNPVENLRDFMHEDWPSNRVFKS